MQRIRADRQNLQKAIQAIDQLHAEI